LLKERSVDHSRVRWTGKGQIAGADGRGHSVVVDAPPEYSYRALETEPSRLEGLDVDKDGSYT